MNKKLISQLEQWFDHDEHHQIIETLLSLPSKALNDELIGHLGRAYNNLSEYDKAIQTLMKTSEKGQTTALWHFRMGYAYFYKHDFEQALALFEKSIALGDHDANAHLFCSWCKDELQKIANRKNNHQHMTTNGTLKNEYTALLKSEKSISVCFYIEQDKLFKIGEKINAINELAYMNGYNWEALFNYYLPKYHPDVFVNMKTDPEAGMYVAYYEASEENEKRAQQFIAIINHFMDNEELLYQLVKTEGHEISWD